MYTKWQQKVIYMVSDLLLHVCFGRASGCKRFGCLVWTGEKCIAGRIYRWLVYFQDSETDLGAKSSIFGLVCMEMGALRDIYRVGNTPPLSLDFFCIHSNGMAWHPVRGSLLVLSQRHIGWGIGDIHIY